jgi:hypothetical protein
MAKGDTAFKETGTGGTGNSSFSLPDCNSAAMRAAFLAINTATPGAYLCR